MAIFDHHPTHYWRSINDGLTQCTVCPRQCKLREGERGFCFMRACVDGAIVLTNYGRSSGFCLDPIEKKPLFHFLPGSSVLSFGTAGCNLACKFCQNHDISRCRDQERLLQPAQPEQIAHIAQQRGAESVAYTYNDPVISLEYVVDTARICRQLGLKNVAVTAGYINAEPRIEMYEFMDAANVDLKGFTEAFYLHYCGGHLQPILETLEYLCHHTKVWLEITTLLIPELNDSDEEIRRMAEWVIKHLRPDVPLHFTAFHPDYRMLDKPPTPAATLLRARRIAKECGLHHVYVGNVDLSACECTYCHHCGQPLIGRDWYQLTLWDLDTKGCCPRCQTPLAGIFNTKPGDFGRQRIPIHW